MSDGIRAKRLAGTVRKHLSGVIARDFTDPRLAALSIEEVSFSGDLGLATVRVRLLFGGEDPAARRGVLDALGRAAPGLRAQLAPLLKMRRVPELRFHYDEGTDHRRRIEEVLAEIHREGEAREPEQGSGDDAERPSDVKRESGD